MQRSFNLAMGRFLREQQTQPPPPPPNPAPNTPDVEMESVESHHSMPGDDLSVGEPRRPAIASTETTAAGGSIAQRICVSAVSELKEFAGKDNDEDRARNWIGKVKSAFTRDQASDSQKCLVFGYLLTGPARNWYRQLNRSTRNT